MEDVYVDSKLELLREQIANGIQCDGELVRSFGIIDYYNLFEENPLIVAQYYGSQLTKLEQEVLKSLHNEYIKTSEKVGKNRIYLAKTLINMKYSFIQNGEYYFNKNNVLVLKSGTGNIYETTQEEREYVASYMEHHSMPLTVKIYYIVLQSYVNKQLPEQLHEREKQKFINRIFNV